MSQDVATILGVEASAIASINASDAGAAVRLVDGRVAIVHNGEIIGGTFLTEPAPAPVPAPKPRARKK